MMNNSKKILALAIWLLSVPAYAEPAGGSAAPGPNFQFTPEDFGIGRKHTPNTSCNREVDKILEDTRQCFNTRPAAECDDTQKKNSKKIATYTKSPRCAKPSK